MKEKKETGFLRYDRELPKNRSIEDRINDYKEIPTAFSEEKTAQQAARCMDCGVPFCHNGCPLGNIIPEFNDAVYDGDWELAAEILYSTNNFPEFTGRICPAPCEASCVLGINKPPVTIEHIEKSIAEKAFEMGLIQPEPPQFRTGKEVAVVGSGPAGLAAAAQLNKAGHWVTVFEKNEKPGGLLRYGIPDFKMEKWVIDRRLEVMEAEGITFKNHCNVGEDISAEELKASFDAVVLCCGAEVPRDLPIEGREFNGIHFAMDFLTQQNRRLSGDAYGKNNDIYATGKHVVVIGGGDTGSDCVGTANRHGAASVTQIELMPKPLDHRTEKDPWPNWPMTLRTSTSHEEGVDRNWGILTKAFRADENGRVNALQLVDIEWKYDRDNNYKPYFEEVPGSERNIPCDLALLAIGFKHVQPEGIIKAMNLELSDWGNVQADEKSYQTSEESVFAAGDARRGQSLVVWAISEGREVARSVDTWLMGQSMLESKNENPALAAR